MVDKKNFITTILVPEHLRKKTHVWELRSIFQKLCSELFKEPYRASVSVKKRSRSYYYCFVVSFGERRPDTPNMIKVIEGLARSSFYSINAKVSMQISNEALESAIKTHQEKCYKEKQHVTVKPNEHIRLC